jgi:hypothetical protein
MTNFIIKTVNEASRIASLKMTRGDNWIVRISGGCGYMDATEEHRLLSFASAFENYKGVIIGGGSRMLYRNDLTMIRPGVTELLTAIKKVSPTCTTVGIVPKIKGDDLELISLPGTHLPIITFGNNDEYITTFNVDNDINIMVQSTADIGVRWEDEYRTALIEMEALKRERKFKTLTLFYNGGEVSRKELMDTIELGWPVVLIKNSGRMCDTYGNDEQFLKEHSNVYVVENPQELKQIITKIKIEL